MYQRLDLLKTNRFMKMNKLMFTEKENEEIPLCILLLNLVINI